MLRNRRIVEEQRREETRKALVEEQQQRMKQQWQTRNKMKQEANHARKRSVDQCQEDWKHNIMVKIMREDEARIRQLGESREVVKREKDDVYYNKVMGHLRDLEENQFKSKDPQLREGPDKVYTELWYRQEKLFKALGERSLNDVKEMLAFAPTILQVKPKKIYQDYGPHKMMQQLLNDLVAKKITEHFFFKESAELVKKMGPAQIIEHYRRQEASRHGTRRLLKVSSQPAIDRFVVAWSAERLGEDRARSVAAQVVADALRHAGTVYSRLMEGSSADLALLGISALDAAADSRQQVDASGVSIGDDHVHFSDRSVTRPRPLASGQTFSDLKPAFERPATPIPGEERSHVPPLGLGMSESMQALVEEIAYQAEKRLRERLKRDGVRRGKEDDQVPVSSSLEDSRDKLRQSVLEKLESIRKQVKGDGKHLQDIPESVHELVPPMQGDDRDKFISDMSRVVSEIIGTTLKQAQNIMVEALNTIQGKEVPMTGASYDSEEDMGGAVPETSARGEGAADEKERKYSKSVQFMPVFGGKDLNLDPCVLISSLAAISVKHSSDRLGHEDHGHIPPVSHMKEFFKNRTSMPIISTTSRTPLTERKRMSLPTVLPECMDSNKMHGRHSFMTVMRPDLKILPEYRSKTQRQVEDVLQDHSLFGRAQELSPTISEEDVLHSEDLDHADDEIAPGRESRPPAVVESTVDSERRDSVAELPASGHGLRAPAGAPRHAVSMPLKWAEQGDSAGGERPSPALKAMQTRSLTASRMMLRCDSDPRLSLRTSTGELHVDIKNHSMECFDHEAYEEPEEELRRIESSALGITADRTASEGEVAEHEQTEDVARRSGSADGGAVLHAHAVDSDDETELRVRHPSNTAGAAETAAQSAAETAAEAAVESAADPAAQSAVEVSAQPVAAEPVNSSATVPSATGVSAESASENPAETVTGDSSASPASETTSEPSPEP